MSVFWTSELIALTNALSNPWPADPNPFVPKNAATISDPPNTSEYHENSRLILNMKLQQRLPKPTQITQPKGHSSGKFQHQTAGGLNLCITVKQKQHVEVIISQCCFLKITSWPSHRYNRYILIIFVLIISYQLPYLYHLNPSKLSFKSWKPPSKWPLHYPKFQDSALAALARQSRRSWSS